MTERLTEVLAQSYNIRQLETVVAAIRGISASRVQHGRSLVGGIGAYTDVISQAIAEALSLVPAETRAPNWSPSRKYGLILFCAEQGFAGAFSERVLDSVKADSLDALNFLIGTRGAAAAKERGIQVAWSAAMPTQVEAIPGFASRLSDALYDRIADGSVERVDLVFCTSRSGRVEVDRRSLLPIDPKPFARTVRNQPPLTTLPTPLLLDQLVNEYVYAQLCEAATHSFIAENEARMMAMAYAKTHIESNLASLSRREHELRQEEITNEVIELAAGSEALSSRP